MMQAIPTRRRELMDYILTEVQFERSAHAANNQSTLLFLTEVPPSEVPGRSSPAGGHEPTLLWHHDNAGSSQVGQSP